MRDYKVNKEAISESFCAEVYEIVRSVPVGRVTTYGEIAALLGKPQCSRMGGKALKQVPMELDLPCHRVVNAQGRLVPGWEEQREWLLSEGVRVKKRGCGDLSVYRWKFDSL